MGFNHLSISFWKIFVIVKIYKGREDQDAFILNLIQVRTMAVFYDLRLMSLVVLMLASQLDVAGAVRVFGLYARDLTGDAFGNPPDPYVKVWCGSTFGGQTEYHKDTDHPRWSAVFNFANCNPYENLKLEVWDKDLNFDDRLGTCNRQVEFGSFTVTCHLSKGTLFYQYELIQ